MKYYYVYILASKKNGTLYTGVTNNLIRRLHEHKNNIADGFTKKYNIKNFIYLAKGAPPFIEGFTGPLFPGTS